MGHGAGKVSALGAMPGSRTGRSRRRSVLAGLGPGGFKPAF